MATPQLTTFAQGLTGDPVVDVTTTGYRWVLNADRTVDWSVSNGFQGEKWTDINSVADHVDFALDLVSYYANIKFNYVGNFATPTSASAAGSEINVSVDSGNQLFSSSNVWAVGLFPATSFNTAYSGSAGDVFLNLNSQANTLASYDPGSIGWALLLHELGHTLGLKHPHDDGGTGHPTFAQAGISYVDNKAFSIMSYEDTYDWNQLSFHPATPMVLDVLALQYLYGPNLTTNTGDSLYNLTTTNLFVTIWDAGGNDMVSAASSTVGWEINLPSLRLSNLVPTLVGLAVPLAESTLAVPHTLSWLTGNIENATGSAFADKIVGNDLSNVIMAGGGNDTIVAGDGVNYLRGDDGNDSITGGVGFDDINGNMGNDTAHGGLGEDWVVGGKDNDMLFGDEAYDLVYGNLGNDTLDGGAGNDIVRGGQDNDVLTGGAGDDYVSGDKGTDTVTGGTGADIFHTFGDAGVDRVLDFNLAQGDRVQLDPGTVYSSPRSAPIR